MSLLQSMDTLSRTNRKFHLLYLLFIAAIPLIFDLRLIDFTLITRQIFLTCFLLISTLLLYWTQKKTQVGFSILFTPAPLLLLCFTFLGVASSISAINQVEAIYTLSKYLIFCAFFMTLLLLFKARLISIGTIISGILLFLPLSFLAALMQMWDLGSFFNPYQVQDIVSTFGNKNLFSSVLFLALPFLLLSTSSATRKSNVLKLLLLTSVLFFLLYLRSRGVWLAIYLGVAVYLIGLIFYPRKDIAAVLAGNKYFIGTASLVFLLFIVLTLIEYKAEWTLFKTAKDPIVNTVQGTPAINTAEPKLSLNRVASTNTLRTRSILWRKTANIVARHPILGVGPGNWKVNFPGEGIDFSSPFSDFNQGYRNYVRPHNDYLWVLAENGITGLAVYLAFFWLCIYYLVKLIRHSTDIGKRHNYILLLSGLAGYLSISFFDFPLERISHQVILFTILAYAATQYYSGIGKELRMRRYAKPFYFTLVLLSITCSLVVSFSRYNSELNIKKMIKSHSELNWRNVKLYVEKAGNPFYNMDPMSTPIDWYAGVAHFAEGNYERATEHFEHAYAAHPNHVHVLSNLGSAYVKLNKIDKGISYYKRALEISADFHEASLNLSAVYFNRGEIDEAFYWIDTCPSDCPDAKYETFLPVILRAKAEMALRKKDQNAVEKFAELLADTDKLVNTYRESKQLGVNFVIYLNETASP